MLHWYLEGSSRLLCYCGRGSADSALSNVSRRVSKDAMEVKGFDTVPKNAADDAGGVPLAPVAILTSLLE